MSDFYDPMGCSLPGSSVEFSSHWDAIYFSKGSSWPRNWTQVSCIAGRFFTDWAMREVLYINVYIYLNPNTNYVKKKKKKESSDISSWGKSIFP